jgi:hypothetical protein
MSACVFVGPTLAVADGAEILDGTFLPPVKLGDVYRAVSRYRPCVIGIVDGYFQWAPAVWHKEILWAIGQGVHVFGAASMGALRAAELAPFGMRGVGRIFAGYRRGHFDGMDDDEAFEDDDEVAVVHGPRESGFRGSSEAMVNIRCTLAHAVQEGVITDATRRALVAQGKAAFFPDRRYSSILAEGCAAGLPEIELAALARWLPGHRVDQKRVDALAMLAEMRAFLATHPPPARAEFAFERTTYWERAEAAFRTTAGLTAANLLTALRLDVDKCGRLDETELRDWYFAHVAEIPVPARFDEWLVGAGYNDPAEFHRDAFVEYLRRARRSGGRP